MKHAQEDHAHDLYRSLVERFAASSPPTDVAIGGEGVHWRCTATRAASVGSISCYDHRGAEYYTSFERDSARLATARTSDKAGTIAAVADWLAGSGVAQLYDRYPFVDRRKRALSKLRDHVVQAAPSLKTTADLQHRGGDIYYLNFKAGDRSCEISFYGKRELPDAKFAWDECELFKRQPANDSELARMLQRWVGDQAPPSTMRREFPFLTLDELADYYERGKPIEGEFIRSWDRIEEFYQQDACQFSAAALSLIRALRRAGYDRQLRAGQSLWTLGLSRSRRHGLRAGQPCIWFHFHGSLMDVTAEFASGNLKRHPIQLTPEVQRLLDMMTAFGID